MERKGLRLIAAVAIDGPAGAGKTTLGLWIAEQLGWRYLETGLLYRAAAWVRLRNKEDTPPGRSLLEDVEVHPYRPPLERGDRPISVRGRPVAVEELRNPLVDRIVTPVASSEAVRQAVNELCLHTIAMAPTVATGRDVASAIAPSAMLKVRLDAPPAVLAARLGGAGATRLTQERTLLHEAAVAFDVIHLDTGRMSIGKVRQAVRPHLATLRAYGE
jgi:cytidylate kinase